MELNNTNDRRPRANEYSGKESLSNVRQASHGNRFSNDGSDGQRSELQHPLSELSEDFIDRTLEVRRAAVIAIRAIGGHINESIMRCTNVFNQHGIKMSNGDEAVFRIKIPDDVRVRVFVRETIEEFERLKNNKMLRIVERSLFIGLFSEFDVFMGNLLTIIYNRKPGLLKTIRKEVSLADLMQFDSLEAVKQDMLNKEIDSFRRDSYIEQFAALETKFSLTLRKFPEWGEFVEIGQRRNLMTHNGGVVTEQYLSICRREGCSIDSKTMVGTELELGAGYYFRACHVLALVAFMLVHTLWKKVLPNESREANRSLYLACYEILRKNDTELAVRIGEFGNGAEMLKGAEEIDARIRCINLAVAYKSVGKISDMRTCLESYDWSASIRDFKLGVEVLNDQYENAALLMRQIGRAGELVDQDAYHDWPLFRDFRHQAAFVDAYREIYGHEFSAKREDEPDAVTVDTRSENGAPLIVVDENDVIKQGKKIVEQAERVSTEAQKKGPQRRKRSMNVDKQSSVE